MDISTERTVPAVRLVGQNDVKIWSLTNKERYRRALQKKDIPLLDSTQPEQTARTVLYRADYVLDAQLITDFAEINTDTILTTEDGANAVAANITAENIASAEKLLQGERDTTLGAIRRLSPSQITSPYRDALRKRSDPFALPLTEADVSKIEWRMFMGAYKGATDFVTKYLWPWPAIHLTRLAAARNISPNMVTLISLIFVFIAMGLFAQGYFVSGCIAGWLMTLLDTVDGKLARVTLTSSKMGDIFDHGIDMIHPPFWYWSWIIGINATAGGMAGDAILLGIIIGGYVLGRLQEGYFIWRFKIEIHVWQPIDTLFRLITARRNPNLIIFMWFALFDLPVVGVWAVAAWTLISLGFHFARIHMATRAGALSPIRSWLADQPQVSA